MKNQFVKIFTWKDNQVVLIKSTCGEVMDIYCRPSTGPIMIELKYESSSIRDIMFETLNSKAITTLIENQINHG